MPKGAAKAAEVMFVVGIGRPRFRRNHTLDPSALRATAIAPVRNTHRRRSCADPSALDRNGTRACLPPSRLRCWTTWPWHHRGRRGLVRLREYRGRSTQSSSLRSAESAEIVCKKSAAVVLHEIVPLVMVDPAFGVRGHRNYHPRPSAMNSYLRACPLPRRSQVFIQDCRLRPTMAAARRR